METLTHANDNFGEIVDACGEVVNETTFKNFNFTAHHM